MNTRQEILNLMNTYSPTVGSANFAHKPSETHRYKYNSKGRFYHHWNWYTRQNISKDIRALNEDLGELGLMDLSQAFNPQNAE